MPRTGPRAQRSPFPASLLRLPAASQRPQRHRTKVVPPMVRGQARRRPVLVQDDQGKPTLSQYANYYNDGNSYSTTAQAWVGKYR